MWGNLFDLFQLFNDCGVCFFCCSWITCRLLPFDFWFICFPLLHTTPRGGVVLCLLSCSKVHVFLWCGGFHSLIMPLPGCFALRISAFVVGLWHSPLNTMNKNKFIYFCYAVEHFCVVFLCLYVLYSSINSNNLAKTRACNYTQWYSLPLARFCSTLFMSLSIFLFIFNFLKFML